MLLLISELDIEELLVGTVPTIAEAGMCLKPEPLPVKIDVSWLPVIPELGPKIAVLFKVKVLPVLNVTALPVSAL